MRRQRGAGRENIVNENLLGRRPHHYDEDDDFRSNYNQSNGYSDKMLQMERLQSSQQHKFENSIEAKVNEGDTLQALALRFHCTVADIKRLNKIDKDNEIYARKVVKIPVTVHSVLLETIPIVHKSGNSSPKHGNLKEDTGNNIRNPLEESKMILEEKLLVASVNAAGAAVTTSSTDSNLRLNSRISPNAVYTDKDNPATSTTNFNEMSADLSSPLLCDMMDDTVPRVRPIRGPSLSALDWSGSDCDMSWVCLFVVILALCFVIPLLYILYLAEHPHHHHNTTTH